MSNIEPKIRIVQPETPDAAQRELAARMRRRPVPFFSAYKQWRNRARRYDPLSILNCALEELQRPAKDALEAARRLPAITCLLVKWIVQDREMDLSGGRPPISPEQFAALRQQIWEIQDVVDLNMFGDSGIQLTMRRLFQPQLEFQARLDKGLFRDAGLIMSLPAGHPLKAMCDQTLGLDLDTYVALSMLLLGYADKARGHVSRKELRGLAEFFPLDQVEAYFRLLAPTLDGLRQRMRERPDARRKVGSELFETPALTHAPLLLAHDEVVIWHPTLVARCLEKLLHRRLADEHKESYAQAFSRVFEDHVVAQAHRTKLAVYDEAAMTRWFPSDSKRVDALLTTDKGVVLVESKAGLYDEDIMCCGDLQWLSQNTRSLRTAVEQLQTVAGLLASEVEVPEEARRTPVFGLIVTNIELRVGSAARLAAMYPSGKLSPKTEVQRCGAVILPLEHIYVVGAPAYDRLTECARKRGLDLISFLGQCVEKDGDPVTTRLGLDDHLNDAGMPDLASPPGRRARLSALERVKPRSGEG